MRSMRSIRKLTWFFVIGISGFLAVSCSGAMTNQAPTITATETKSAENVIETQVEIPASATPTKTPIPSATPTPEPTPTPELRQCEGAHLIFYSYSTSYQHACIDDGELLWTEPWPHGHILPNGDKFISDDDGFAFVNVYAGDTVRLPQTLNDLDINMAFGPTDDGYVGLWLMHIIREGEYSSTATDQIWIIHLPSLTVSERVITTETLYTDDRRVSIMHPAWSPDGTQMAVYDLADQNLFVVDIDCNEDHECAAGSIREIPSPQEGYYWGGSTISWAPNSNTLLISCYDEPDARIIEDTVCLVGLDNGSFRAAAPRPEDGESHRIYWVDWSLDGEYIAFDVARFGVYILDADSLEEVALISDEYTDYSSPFWIE